MNQTETLSSIYLVQVLFNLTLFGRHEDELIVNQKRYRCYRH